MSANSVGWGDPASCPGPGRAGLTRAGRRLLERSLGPLPGAPSRPTPPTPQQLAASRLSAAQRRALAAAAPLREDPPARLAHLGGKSYLDLLHRRAGEATGAPDGVATPRSADEVAALLAAASAHQVAVLPFGGATSVVGGLVPCVGDLAAATPLLALDTGSLDQVLELNHTDLSVRVQPGVTGPRLEAVLAEHGLTLGHWPQSFELATLGGYLATRSAGQASTGYGRISDMVLGLELVTPAGRLRLGRGAASAAGPDLLALAVGSEGAFGVITEATLRVRRRGERRLAAFMLRSWPAALAALRELAQRGEAPDIARLSDPTETAANLALAGTGAPARGYLRLRGARDGALLICGWDGPAGQLRRRAALARRVLIAHGGVALGAGPARAWERARFAGPYLRDDLLDLGLLVETVETSARWSELELVHAEVARALEATLAAGGTPAMVGCHVSHLYPHGASLYYTVLARQSADPVGQWQAAKIAASEAMLARGATITHHHGVGRDHRRWLAEEVGELGVQVLAAIKGVLDPAGVCNPGVLVPPDAMVPPDAIVPPEAIVPPDAMAPPAAGDRPGR